jgi:DNA-binding beta-propeller fold protein YncE
MKCERMPGLRSRRTIQSLAQENACAEKPHFDILRGDIQNLKWSKSIPGFKKTQGVAYIPSPNKVFVASGDDGMLRVFRGDSLELLDSIKLEPGPNRVNYDPHKSILYVGYGGKDAGKDYGEVGIIDAETDKRLDDIKVNAHPRSFCWTSPEKLCTSSFLGQAKCKLSIPKNARWFPPGR